MARSDFGGTSNDILYKTSPFMRPTSGTLTFWDSETDGAQHTDLLLNDSPASTITVPATGFIPLFQGPDGVTEMWADEGAQGGPRARMVTSDGPTAAAVMAAIDAVLPAEVTDQLAADPNVAAAVSTAVASRVAGLNLVQATNDDNPFTTYARLWLDAVNRVALGITKDGHVRAPYLDTDKVNIPGAGSITSDVGGTYVAGHVDAANRYAEDVIGRDGRSPQWVLDAQVGRFDQWKLTQRARTRYMPDRLPATILRDGTLRRANSRLDVIECDGDSLTQGGQDPADTVGGWPGYLDALLPDATVNNRGSSGRTSTELVIRCGAVVPLITVTGNTVPASGSVAVTAILPTTSYRSATTGTWSITGTLAGIPGTLTHDQTQASPAAGWSFTRTTSGSATTIRPTEAFLVASPGWDMDAIRITALGRNNIGAVNNLADALRDMHAELNQLGPESPYYLVCPIIRATFETKGSTDYNGNVAANAAAAAQFGDRFIDVQAYIIANGLSENGLTPTSQDLADIAGGVIPTQLRAPSDNLHLNQYGYRSWANCLRAALIAKGWA